MEKRIQIGIRLPPSLIADVDRYRMVMDFPPDRTEIIERAVRWYVERHPPPKAQRQERRAS